MANVSVYLSPVRWPDIYSICLSQLDGGKDSFPLDGYFLPLSLSVYYGIMREQLLRIILLPSLVRFSLIYWISYY